MSLSTMFLSNVTVVDHAYVNSDGAIIGGSFNPSFLVSGTIDAEEQVVVDFSTIKKEIKQIIDDKVSGFDHKLWFIEQFSAGKMKDTGNVVTITTPVTSTTVPSNSIKHIVDDTNVVTYSVDSIGLQFGLHVERELKKLHPNSNIMVECINSIDHHCPTSNKEISNFRYVHGLKNSTSWGCQNISHGHLSFIQMLPSSPETTLLQDKIANDLDNTVFVYADNVLENSSDFVKIGYTTARGTFNVAYDKRAYKIIILNVETTIEHLIDFVTSTYATELDALGITHVLVSEGLSKGACVSISA